MFFGLFAIYGWMVFCFISTELACFVQNVVDWAFGIILCIVCEIRLECRLGLRGLHAHTLVHFW